MVVCVCLILCLLHKLVAMMEEEDDDGPVCARDDEIEIAEIDHGVPRGFAGGCVTSGGLVGCGLAGAGRRRLQDGYAGAGRHRLHNGYMTVKCRLHAGSAGAGRRRGHSICKLH